MSLKPASLLCHKVLAFSYIRQLFMLFNSIIFILFAFLFFGVNQLVRHKTGLRLAWLVLASFVFYGWWDWRFLFLIIFSGMIDYLAALGMDKFPRQKRLLFFASIVANVGSLSLFKYSGFIASNIDRLFGFSGAMSLSASVPDFFLITPVGISFYTFQSMSYTFDVYRGRLKPVKNVLQFFGYLAMFPQLVAGPIVRATEMLPQLLKPNTVRSAGLWFGMQLVVRGFFKKMVIADNLAPIVVEAFGNPAMNQNTAYWWGAIIAFALQIYCDFSGYSDIARGLARWMGYQFPDNFNHPYIARSFKSFWNRWHISLSTWFRDYFYIALGGNRKGRLNAHLFMWLTMVVSGLWHGAAWTFVCWGALHALFLSVERQTNWPAYLEGNIFGRFVAWFLVTVQVLVAWVFFRAESMGQAMEIVDIMFSFRGSWDFGWGLNGSVYIGAMVLRELVQAWPKHKFVVLNDGWKTLLECAWYGLLIAMILFFRGNGSEFIYFQF
jgi:alginate O-acetyltransferase complex protein AlgI